MKYRSTTHYVIASLVPYTEANLKLAFKPNLFFIDLDRLSRQKYSKGAVRNAYYRVVKDGFVELDEQKIPRLTQKGEQSLQRYQPKKLGSDASILLIFDIPETDRAVRNKLRATLRELKFTPVQQSVWRTEYDVLDYLKAAIDEYKLEAYVQIYESVRMK